MFSRKNTKQISRGAAVAYDKSGGTRAVCSGGPQRLSILAFQISCDLGELGEGGLEIFYDLGGDDGGIGKIAAFRDFHCVNAA